MFIHSIGIAPYSFGNSEQSSLPSGKSLLVLGFCAILESYEPGAKDGLFVSGFGSGLLGGEGTAGAVVEAASEDSLCWRSTLPLELGVVVEGLGAAGEDATFATGDGEETGNGLGDADGDSTSAAGCTPSHGGGLDVPGAQLKVPSWIPLHTSSCEMVFPLKENSYLVAGTVTTLVRS